MVKLADKRVAVIGTGATAIQCVPFLGEYAQQLYVFLRTPSSIDLRGNKPTDPDWARSLKPGWQRERRENFNDIVIGKPFDILGEGGQSLFDYWGEGIRTLHGHSSRGFPNWFFVGIGQNGLSVNMTAMFDDQARHIAYIIREAQVRGAVTVQTSQGGEDGWVSEIRRLGIHTNTFIESCTPGYYHSEGQFDGAVGSFAGEAYSPGANAFNALLAAWRETGQLDGLELRAEK